MFQLQPNKLKQLFNLGRLLTSQRAFSDFKGPNPQRGYTNSSIDPKEVELFSKIKDWWDPYGSQRALHAYNHARVNYIKRILNIKAAGELPNKHDVFEGLDVIDVGCGAGLFCESAARLKGNILGIDATLNSIQIAQAHADQDQSVVENITYVHTSSGNNLLSKQLSYYFKEEVARAGYKFDVVTSLEVIEHVQDKRFFVDQLAQLTKNRGFVFVSTINKTLLAYGVTILGAEVITRIVPRGTHEWDKFISPEDLCFLLQSYGLRVVDVQGFKYNPFNNTMVETKDTSVNYIVTCRKE